MTFASLLPELALGFLALFAAYLLGARHQRREAVKPDAKSERPDDVVCFAGPLDGMKLPRASSWHCIEYPDSRGACAVTGQTASILHSSGQVYLRGIYWLVGHRYTWRPMRSHFCNSLLRAPRELGEE